MATHSSILAWRIPWTDEPAGYSPWGPKESDMTEHTHITTHTKRDRSGLIFLKLGNIVASLYSDGNEKYRGMIL